MTTAVFIAGTLLLTVIINNILLIADIFREWKEYRYYRRRLEGRARAYEESAERLTDPDAKARALAISYSLRAELEE